MDSFRNQFAAAIEHPIYGWLLVVAAAVTVAAWAWGLGTFMQWFTDTAIVTTTAIN